MTPPPPVPFPTVTVRTLPKGRWLTRIHDKRFGATSFNPGLGAPTRFAPLLPPGDPPIPHAYAAGSFECAAHETVFHEIQFDAPVKTVASDKLDPLMLSRVRCLRQLRLACLFEPDLNRWGITRAGLIDTFATAYGDTVKWALAIHANTNVDGLIWTSKRCDPQISTVLFGDRVLSSDLEEINSRSLKSGRSRKRLESFAARAGISVIGP